MHPLATELKAEIVSATTILNQPSATDTTFQQFLTDARHSTSQKAAILTWLPNVDAKLDEIVTSYEAMVDARDREIAALKANLEPLPQDVPTAPDEYPNDAISGLASVDEITAHKRPPLRDINSA